MQNYRYFVVCFLLGNSPTSEFYIPTFRNTLSPSSYLPAYEGGTECSETSAYKIQTPGNYPNESIQHSEHGESLKSRISIFLSDFNQIWSSLTGFCKSPPISYLMEIRLVGATLILADGRTDMTKPVGAFSDRANGSKTRENFRAKSRFLTLFIPSLCPHRDLIFRQLG
jgi:hypothetical protein